MPSRQAAPDEPARTLIRERLDVNLVVEAGAGSGKTESLAQRMAAGIVEGVYTVERTAAVTFTRKAAAELRARFQLALEKRLTDDMDAVRRARVERALGHLERLFAGTIHAFCAHLLRERPVEAGVAPGFTELDEAEDLELRRRAWREHVAALRAEGSPLLEALAEAGVELHHLDDAFATVCTFSEVNFPAEDVALPDPGATRTALEEFCRRLSALLPTDIDPQSTCGVQNRAREFRGRLRVLDPARPRDLAELLGRWEKPPGLVQKWWPGTTQQRKQLKAEVDGLIEAFGADTARPFLAAWRQRVYRVAMGLLLGARERAAALRRRSVSLNYGDLLELAARLLRENTEVRAALQLKYRWLFVDEFQDTDPIQAEVIFLLAAAPGGEHDWTRVGLRPGALFIVGDPKQSIYRFRRADIDTYLRVRQRIEETGGQVVELTASFRSVPTLCEWANAVFGEVFPTAPTPQQPAFHGLQPTRPGPRLPTSGVRVLTHPDTVPQGDLVALDADAIARFIKAEVAAARRRPGDFLILTRKKKPLPIYTRALESLRLPVEVSGGAAFTGSSEVAALAGLLLALADPDDGPAVVGVLRGSLFGLSDDALFGHRRSERGFLVTAPDLEAAPGPVGEALRDLRVMYDWTRSLPIAAAVERMLERTGLLALAAASAGGGEAGDLLHAVDRMRQITEAGGTLADAAAALEEDLESTEVETVPLEPGRRDVVRVMNLHKAKGLEAPVVFLADPVGGVGQRADSRIVRDGARAVGYFRLTRSSGEWNRTVIGEPAGWPEHEAAELAYVTAEESRLLYVAATRARDLLVVSRWAKPGGRGTRAWSALDPHLAAAEELEISRPAPSASAPLPDLGAAIRAAAEAERTARRDSLLRPSWQVESVTATTHRGAQGGEPVQAQRTREPDAGMAWGSLVHALLEHAMRGPQQARAQLERLANWLTMERPELRYLVPEALDTVERVMDSEFWRRAQSAVERQVEVPFAVRIGDGATPTILHGVIDLAFRQPDGWNLVDYKTDRVDMEVLERQYAAQVNSYAAQWARLTGGSVFHAGLFSVRLRELSRSLSGVARPQE